MLQEKEYFAFISYKREDEKWAKWLQDKLEHYRFPANLNGLTDLPKHIRPTFRDVTDLTPGLLAEKIKNALHNSEWLIVVCSPRSAKSPWVCKEAQTFIDSGRADHIIPFVIEGNPFSNDTATECYPEALLNLTGSKELLAVNINDMGRDAAAVKVVASMFGLKFDTLWQRYEKEQRKQRNRKIGYILGFFSTLAVVSLIFAFFMSNKNDELNKANIEISKAKDKAEAQYVRAEEANTSLSLANDRIIKQNTKILSQRDSLNLYNKQLLEERKRVLLATHKNQEQYLLLVSQKANEMMDNGDFLGAKNQLLQIEKMNLMNAIYTPEIEQAIRRTTKSNAGIIKAHINSIKDCQLSPDGEAVVSVANDEDIKIWNTYNGELLYSIPNPKSYPKIKFSPNGNLFLSYNDSVTIWDISNFKKVYSFINQYGNLADIDKTNSMLFTEQFAKNNKINIVDGNTGKLLSSIIVSNKYITTALFIPNNQIITASLDDSIRIYSIGDKSVVRKWKAHENGVDFININRTGSKIVSGGYDQCKLVEQTVKVYSIKIWDAKSGRHISTIPTLARFACFTPDDSYIIAIKEKDIIIINSTAKSIIKTIKGHDTEIKHLNMYDASFFVTASRDDGVIRLWDDFGINFTEQNKESMYVLPNSFFPKGNKFLIANQDSIMIFNAHPYHRISGIKSKYTSSIRFDKNGNKFITAGFGANIWDANSLKHISLINAETEYADISPNGNEAVTVEGDAISVWDISKHKLRINKPIFVLKCNNQKAKVNMATFSPDGKNVISAHDDGIIRIWDQHKQSCIDSLMGHATNVNTAFYSHNGKYIISASADKTIKIWDVKSKKCISNLVGHTAEVCYAEFNNDDKWVISTSADNSIIIWDRKSGMILNKYYTRGTTASISANSNFLLFALSKKSFQLLPYPNVRELWDKMKWQMNWK